MLGPESAKPCPTYAHTRGASDRATTQTRSNAMVTGRQADSARRSELVTRALHEALA